MLISVAVRVMLLNIYSRKQDSRSFKSSILLSNALNISKG